MYTTFSDLQIELQIPGVSAQMTPFCAQTTTQGARSTVPELLVYERELVYKNSFLRKKIVSRVDIYSLKFNKYRMDVFTDNIIWLVVVFSFFFHSLCMSQFFKP